MQNHATRDLAVGLFVLVGLLALGYLSLQVGGLEFSQGERIALKATFDDIGGLSSRAPVKVAGVKIGEVSGIELDDDLRAIVHLEIDAEVGLSIDSSAAIRTAGLARRSVHRGRTRRGGRRARRRRGVQLHRERALDREARRTVRPRRGRLASPVRST